MDADTRWAQQAAVPEDLTIDTATGGTMRIDARNTWWLNYDVSGRLSSVTESSAINTGYQP